MSHQFKWFIKLLLFSTLLSCGGQDASKNSASSVSHSSSSINPTQIQCSHEDIQSLFARNNCMLCHNAQIFTSSGGDLNLDSPELGREMLDAPSKHGGFACQSEKLIDASDPDNSLILKLVNQNLLAALNAGACKRQPMPQTGPVMDTADFQCLASWVRHTAKTELPTNEPPTEPQFKPALSEQILGKLKTILHGAAPSSEELNIIGGAGSQPSRNDLKMLIQSWENSEAYKAKISDFLGLALQQKTDPRARYIAQLNGLFNAPAIDAPALVQNLREMFTRTAWEIVANEQDFRQVVTTRKWQVTSAVLSAIAYADKPNQTPGRAYNQATLFEHRFRNFAHFKESDYSDWRSVEFVQSNTPMKWENSAAHAASMRNIKNAEKIATRYPRVGFFSTLAFNENWATNDDNQFRVTIQQTLITALDKAFTPDDPTPHISENGIPLDHADPQTVCYQCHRLMDPLRLIFSNHQETNGRAKDNNAKTQAYFTLEGVSKKVNTVNAFANTLANHPRFPGAWIQKLCMWGNSQRCSEADPEFVRLKQFFQTSNYNFKLLIREFFSSPIFTLAEAAEIPLEQNSLISMSRGNHFCHAMNARVTQLNQLNGTSKQLNICDKELNLGVISADVFARGETHFIQSTQTGAFDARSIDSRCGQVANVIFANDKSRIIDLSLGIQSAIKQLVEVIIGLPPNHPRHPKKLQELTRIYDLASHQTPCSGDTRAEQQESIQCGFGQGKLIAMRNVWFAACTSPDLHALGL